MTHDQSVHHTKHLHPVFVMAVIGFFFILLFVLFQTMGDRSSNPSERSYPDKEPKAVIATKAEPRFDRQLQERVGPFRYTSEFLKISFDVPQGYRVEEKLTTIRLVKNEPDEIINIVRISSNAINLTDYFDNFNRYKFQVLNEAPLENEYEYESLMRTEKINATEIRNAVYIYHDLYTIFILSTSGASKNEEALLAILAADFQ